MLEWQDPEIYDELLDTFPVVVLGAGAGLAFMENDVFGFLIKNREVAAEEMTHIYRCRQVKADKLPGSGEAIFHGQRVFAVRVNPALPWTTPQDVYVTHNPAGVLGTDFLFCGWAKEDAIETDATVLINFDGTRPLVG